VTNVIDARPGELAIGAEVTLGWEPIDGGTFLPRFAIRGNARAADA
jgi:hypothetical protein